MGVGVPVELGPETLERNETTVDVRLMVVDLERSGKSVERWWYQSVVSYYEEVKGRLVLF